MSFAGGDRRQEPTGAASRRRGRRSASSASRGGRVGAEVLARSRPRRLTRGPSTVASLGTAGAPQRELLWHQRSLEGTPKGRSSTLHVDLSSTPRRCRGSTAECSGRNWARATPASALTTGRTATHHSGTYLRRVWLSLSRDCQAGRRAATRGSRPTRRARVAGFGRCARRRGPVVR